MKRVVCVAFLALMVTATACQSFSAFANEMAPNSAINKARDAMRSGELGSALNLYQTVLSTAAGDEDLRDEALFNLALIHISSDPEYRNLSAAQEHLAKLQSAGTEYRALEVTALLTMVREMRSLVSELQLKDEKIREIAQTALGASRATQN